MPIAIRHRPAPDPHAAVGLDPTRIRRRRARSRQFQELMLEKGTNLTQLAKAVGINHSYMSRIAGGHRVPSLSVARALAHALNLDIETLADVLLGQAEGRRSVREAQHG